MAAPHSTDDELIPASVKSAMAAQDAGLADNPQAAHLSTAEQKEQFKQVAEQLGDSVHEHVEAWLSRLEREVSRLKRRAEEEDLAQRVQGLKFDEVEEAETEGKTLEKREKTERGTEDVRAQVEALKLPRK